LFRPALLAVVVASPAGATTCQEYVAMMRAEGIRTLVKAECISPSEAASLAGHWNEILDGPYGACLASRAVAGNKEVWALTVYMTDMNRQKDAQGCPPERKP